MCVGVCICVCLSGMRVSKAFFAMDRIRGEWRGLGQRADGGASEGWTEG